MVNDSTTPTGALSLRAFLLVSTYLRGEAGLNKFNLVALRAGIQGLFRGSTLSGACVLCVLVGPLDGVSWVQSG
jgi:hypothetical protein